MPPIGKLFGETALVGLAGRDAIVFYDGSVEAASAADTVAMNIRQRSWKLITDGTNATTMTLPPVAEAAGMIFLFYLVTDGGQNVTITDDADDADFTDVTMDTENDAFVLVSDGIHWFAISGNATT